MNVVIGLLSISPSAFDDSESDFPFFFKIFNLLVSSSLSELPPSPLDPSRDFDFDVVSLRLGLEGEIGSSFFPPCSNNSYCHQKLIMI